MNISELENFTIKELELFSCNELELDAGEILRKMRSDNRQLPLSVAEKLQTLCQDMPNSEAVVKKGLTIAEAVGIITAVLAYLNQLPDLSKKYTPIIQEIIEEITKLFS